MQSSTEVRTKLHQLIDAIKSDELLLRLQEFLSRPEVHEDAGVWSTLTPDQQERVLKAYASSMDPANLKATGEVLKRGSR